MAKIISISNDVYESLTKMKGKNSYSVTIRKLIVNESNKDRLLEFFGKGGMDVKKIKELDKSWKKWTQKYV